MRSEATTVSIDPAARDDPIASLVFPINSTPEATSFCPASWVVWLPRARILFFKELQCSTNFKSSLPTTMSKPVQSFFYDLFRPIHGFRFRISGAQISPRASLPFHTRGVFLLQTGFFSLCPCGPLIPQFQAYGLHDHFRILERPSILRGVSPLTSVVWCYALTDPTLAGNDAVLPPPPNLAPDAHPYPTGLRQGRAVAGL